MDVSVFLVDDHEIVRRGVRTLIESEPGLVVVGEASTMAEALVRIPLTRPNVAVLDLQLPDGTGVELCRELRESIPEVACLILTSFSDDEAVVQATLAGAAGYVLKQVRGADIVSAIKAAAAGQLLIDPVVAARVAERLHESATLDDRLESLSPQERRILDRLALGASNREIADELCLAEKTVKNYVSALLSKMGMSRRTEAAVYAARLEERRKFAGSWDRSDDASN